MYYGCVGWLFIILYMKQLDNLIIRILKYQIRYDYHIRIKRPAYNKMVKMADNICVKMIRAVDKTFKKIIK